MNQNKKLNKTKKILFILGFLIISIIGVQQVFAADIGNLTGHAWMEGYGFVSMNGAGAAVDYGVTATTTGLSGYAWSEKLGWINFDDSGEMYAVTNDPAGNLCGYAWSEKVGYISFCDKSANKYYAVTVQEDGSLTGYAWSEKMGYINMNDDGALYGVATSWSIPVINAHPVIFRKGIILNKDLIIK